MFSIGRRERGYGFYCQSLGDGRNSPTALFDIGFFFLDDLKSADEALPFLQRAAALDPYDPFKQATLAHAQLEAERGVSQQPAAPSMGLGRARGRCLIPLRARILPLKSDALTMTMHILKVPRQGG